MRGVLHAGGFVITLLLFVVVACGSLVTILAMEGEAKAWRKPIVMSMGLLLTALALAGTLAREMCK